MKKALSFLNAISEFLGSALSWLIYATMLVTCSVVVLRYGFDISIIAMQESITYLHACVFMLGIAFTLKRDGHVRVDIFYRRYSPRTKALIDLIGTLIFLIPLCVFILMMSWDFVANSWAVSEKSVEAEGIPAVYLLKTLLPAMAVLLLLQAIAELLKNALLLRETQHQHD